MDSTRKCPRCGQALPADAPQGLCPACLMQAGFPTGPQSEEPGSGAAGKKPAFTPPLAGELAPLFPQLEILELIGQGGMGAVYKARQPELDRLVALKILAPQTANDPGFAERFGREARALARLSHPNIVAVYDYGRPGGFHYFIMEYVDGANLRQIERAGKLASREALKIIPQICEALQFAHDEGIVHRDIKPENILLDKKGRVKIADFGLAKIFSADGSAPPVLTEAGHVMGTPHYMAPEQVEHPLEVDHRADIYSLGVVFYEMLTGELPLGRFAAPSAKAAMDVRLDDVVLRTLEKEPGQRYQQASQVKTDVETISRVAAEAGKKSFIPPAWKYLWAAGMALALAFLLVDSYTRERSIQNTAEISTRDAMTPLVDSRSPTGYAGNQHVQIMPALGTDGYHWIMQTEQMLNIPAGPDAGWRVRHVDYDGLPGGRDVHWSSSLRWLLAGLAWTDHVLRGEPMALALEHTAPWANTFVLALMIIFVPWVTWRRLGPVAAGLLALCFVTVYPYYEFSFVGYFDHHGLAASSDLLMVLFLIAGGAGWLKGEKVSPERLAPGERMVWEWLPERRQAKRWFIASGVVGGVGLWVSAASVVPPMFGIAAAAIMGTGWLGRSNGQRAIYRAEPSLWRIWGITGAATSLFFYLLEYYPSHFSWRLEVNHPLYALAMLAAGDLLCRVCRLLHGTVPARWGLVMVGGWLMVDVLALALVPLAILKYGEAVFGILPGTFLVNFHVDYILEFREFVYQMSLLTPLQIVGGISMIPFAVVPVGLLLGAPGLARPWRALLLVGLLPALLMLVIAALQIRWLGLGCAVSVAELAGAALVISKIWPEIPWTKIAVTVGAGVLLGGWLTYYADAEGAPWKVVGVAMVVALTIPLWTRWHKAAGVFAVTLACLSFLVPWVANTPAVWDFFKQRLATPETLNIANIAWTIVEVAGAVLGAALGLMLPGLMVAGVGAGFFRWSGRECARAIYAGLVLIFVMLVVLPFPIFTAYQWFATDFNEKSGPTELDLTQVVTRDVAQKLRARLGSEQGTILSGPTTTTWMMYFGGFRGLGTLYWENTDGMKAAAAIYSAKTDGEALRLIKENHVTHIVIYSWDAFATEYARLGAGLRKPANEAESKAQNEQLQDAFILRLLRDHQVPSWLRAIPYRIPDHPWLKNAYAVIYEVALGQSEEEYELRVAQAELALGTTEGRVAAAGRLLRLEAKHPDYLPAFVNDALLSSTEGNRTSFLDKMTEVMKRLDQAAKLSLEDRVDLEITLLNAVKRVEAASELHASLAVADERGLRRVQPEKLALYLQMAVRLTNLSVAERKVIGLGIGLLPVPLQAQVLKRPVNSPPPPPAPVVRLDRTAEAVQWLPSDGGNGHYYQTVSSAKGVTWEAAQKEAKAKGGYLVTITSAAENKFVFSLINSPAFWRASTVAGYEMGPWIGGVKTPEGWRWENNEGPITYFNWDPAEPDGQGTTPYSLHYYSSIPGRRGPTWDDENPTAILMGFVIEYDHNPASDPATPAGAK